MKTLFLDTETYSATPIKNGTYAYAENAEVMIATYAIDDGPVTCLDLTALPGDALVLADAIESAGVIVAHNAMFDRNVLRLGNLKIEAPIWKWRCCMVKALLHGLPGSLDKLCGICKVPMDQAKQKDGKRLIHLFCKPRPKNMKLRRATRLTHPADWAKFLEYATSDITAMRAVWNALPSWNYGDDKVGAIERDLWHLDQLINDRGVAVDLDLVAAAIRATESEQARLRVSVKDMTRGYVTSANKRDKLIEHIFAEYGYGLTDLTGATVSKMLARDDIPEGVRELLRIREQASQTSTAKYNAFQRGVNSDGRLRGMLQFSGASRTRRDAGRTVQLQNLPSRGLLPHDQVVLGIQAMMTNSEALAFTDVMLLTASAIRSVIVAPPGKKLVVADLSNIEGRALAWLAGEEWKLQAFRDFDQGKGHDLYKLAYAKSFNVAPESVDKFQRSIGKVQELGLGYAGGINAFVTFALVYGIDLEAMADTAWPYLPGDILEEAQDFVEWLAGKGTTWPMTERAAVVCEVFKRTWRSAHPMTVKLWKEAETGFRNATLDPGKTYAYRGLKFRRDGAWLRIRLPSGRYLCYLHPQVDEKGECSFMGVNQFTKSWGRIKTYSGKLVENITQSIARDFMFDALPGIEASGYSVTMRVHDEVVSEAPDTDDYSAEGLSSLLATVPEWGAGMPLAAAGFEDYRYRKD